MGARVAALGVVCFLTQFVRLASWVFLRRSYRHSADDEERFAQIQEARETEGRPPGNDG